MAKSFGLRQIIESFRDDFRMRMKHSGSHNHDRGDNFTFVPTLGKEHPLCNPYILEIIFSNLCVEDLKACTLVSHTWYNEAVKYLKEKSIITIDNSNTLKKYMFKILPLRRGQENLNPFSITPSIPVNLRACQIIFNQNMNIRNNESLTDFIVEHGECIETLSIDLVSPLYANTQLRRILQSVNLTHLSKLILVIPVYSGYSINYDITPLPTVQELKVLQYYGSSDLSNRQNNLDTIYKALPNLRKVSGLPMEFLIFSSATPPLEVMKSELKLKKHDLNGFARKMFPLCKLSVVGGGSDQHQVHDWVDQVKMSTLVSILGNCAGTLSKLTLKDLNLRFNLTQFNLMFPKLKSLTLDRCSENLVWVNRLNSHSVVPNLKSLKIIDNLNEVIELDDMLPMDGIKKLDVESSIHISPAEICRVFRCFPRLKFLKVNRLGDQGIQEVFQFGSELEVLILESGQFSDLGLACTDSKIFGLQPKRIADLTKLREIQLQSEKLTDPSVLRLLLECKYLHSITIKGCKMSVNSIEELTERLDLQCLRATLLKFEKMDYSQAKNILANMRGKELIVNNQVAPSRDLNRQKIKEFLTAISCSNGRHS